MSSNTNLGSYTTNSGENNTSIGAGVLSNSNVDASNNTGLGAWALNSNTTGVTNVAIGANSLFRNKTGNNNVGVGPATLLSITSTSDNTAVGANALEFNTTGDNNTALGAQAGYYDVRGSHNTYLGADSGPLEVDFIPYKNSTAIGYGANFIPRFGRDGQIVIGITGQNVIIPGNLTVLGKNSSSTGPTGSQGSVGPQGSTGCTGPQGSTGYTGPQGRTGFTGPQGVTGTRGFTGIQGFTGPQGYTGATGPQGVTGRDGSATNTGATGPQGPTGYIGPQGPTGTLQTIGPYKGPWSTTYPNGSSEGYSAGDVVSYASDPLDVTTTLFYAANVSGSNTLTPNPSTQTLFWTLLTVVEVGPTGDTGYTGPQGNAATLTGATGYTGPQGSTGYTGPQGSTGSFSLSGVNYSDYIYWDTSTTPNSFQVATDGRVHIGRNAGSTSQGTNAVAIGDNAGASTQGQYSVAIGNQVGVSTQGQYSVAIGNQAADITQGTSAVAIGDCAGNTSQGTSAVAIGYLAGASTQGTNAVAIGIDAGFSSQGTSAVAIGDSAGNTGQGQYSVAIGYQAADTTQGTSAVAIGNQAGYSIQGSNTVAIGTLAGYTGQGNYSIAIGYNSGLNENLVSGSESNVFLGSNTSSDGVAAYTNSSAIGPNAQITGSNQMVLGVTGTSVTIPGYLYVSTRNPIIGAIGYPGNTNPQGAVFLTCSYPDFTQLYKNASGGTITAVDGTSPVTLGTSFSLSVDNWAQYWVIMPGFGLKLWEYSSYNTLVLDVWNQCNQPVTYKTLNQNVTGASLYYNGKLLPDYNGGG